MLKQLSCCIFVTVLDLLQLLNRSWHTIWSDICSLSVVCQWRHATPRHATPMPPISELPPSPPSPPWPPSPHWPPSRHRCLIWSSCLKHQTLDFNWNARIGSLICFNWKKIIGDRNQNLSHRKVAAGRRMGLGRVMIPTRLLLLKYFMSCLRGIAQWIKHSPVTEAVWVLTLTLPKLFQFWKSK